MKLLVCINCGSKELTLKDGYRVCSFCRSRYAVSAEDLPYKASSIALGDDISALLNKCRADPANARRYASLVLDLDPGNTEALKYLKGR